MGVTHHSTAVALPRKSSRRLDLTTGPLLRVKSYSVVFTFFEYPLAYISRLLQDIACYDGTYYLTDEFDERSSIPLDKKDLLNAAWVQCADHFESALDLCVMGDLYLHNSQTVGNKNTPINYRYCLSESPHVHFYVGRFFQSNLGLFIYSAIKERTVNEWRNNISFRVAVGYWESVGW